MAIPESGRAARQRTCFRHVGATRLLGCHLPRKVDGLARPLIVKATRPSRVVEHVDLELDLVGMKPDSNISTNLLGILALRPGGVVFADESSLADRLGQVGLEAI